MNDVVEYYKYYDEENRLKRDNMHRVEYDTTIFYLDKIIEQDHKVLDIGAGTGAYSFHYAMRGNKVIALDVSPKNIDIMKNKLLNKGELDIDIKLGDGRDLSQYRDDSVDVVLCMGPMYHIKKQEDRLSCIEECLRVLKKGGKLVISYINKYAVLINEFRSKKEAISSDEVFNILDNKHSDGCFVFTDIYELRNMLGTLDVSEIMNIATDGIGHMICDTINSYNNEEYQRWLEYHISTCTKDILLGYSLHGLCICEKK